MKVYTCLPIAKLYCSYVKNEIILELVANAPGSRYLAERSANPDVEASFYDSGDKCNICHFALNHPEKFDKPKTKCRVCGQVAHKLCINKSACSCALICYNKCLKLECMTNILGSVKV